MRLMVLDYETFFDSDYTLKKESTESYVRHARFEPLLCAVRWADEDAARWVGKEDLPAFLGSVDWSQTAVVAHHAQFDGLILAHHYGHRPAKWFDTISMARLMLGGHVSMSLEALAAHFGLPAKTVPYELFKGRNWVNLDPQTRELLGAGALHDSWLTLEIFKRLIVGFPPEELEVIDKTIRLFTEPRLIGDAALFHKIAYDEDQKKNQTLLELGTTSKELQSADKFTALLEAEGVEIEFKAGKNGPIPAIAKTDEFMKGLLEDENERVAALASARLEVRSTISQTRAGRLAAMSERGPLTVYLRYAGAHTSRFSGGDSLNWQNFPKPQKSPLRSGVCAPDGWLIAKVDASQIECRILNCLAGQDDVVENFRQKKDPYVRVASEFYGFEVTKANEVERQVGKKIELGCGFGMGWRKFIATLRAESGILLDEHGGQRAVTVYRDTHPMVVTLWKTANRMIAALAGTDRPIQWGPMVVETGRITLPNGIPLHYPDLRHDVTIDTADGPFLIEGWSYAGRYGRKKLYGGKLVENVVQALARLYATQALLRITKSVPLPWVNMEHDAHLFLVPNNGDAPGVLQWILSQMRVAPAWMPHLPLDAEGTLGERMG